MYLFSNFSHFTAADDDEFAHLTFRRNFNFELKFKVRKEMVRIPLFESFPDLAV